MSNPQRTLLQAALGAFAFTNVSRYAAAQAAWPERAVNYIVPFTPGGSTDIIGRTLTQKIGRNV